MHAELDKHVGGGGQREGPQPLLITQAADCRGAVVPRETIRTPGACGISRKRALLGEGGCWAAVCPSGSDRPAPGMWGARPLCSAVRTAPPMRSVQERRGYGSGLDLNLLTPWKCPGGRAAPLGQDRNVVTPAPELVHSRTWAGRCWVGRHISMVPNKEGSWGSLLLTDVF